MLLNKNKLFYLGGVIIIIPYIFWLILGENSFVFIYDNLDSEFVYIQSLLESGNLFGFNLNGQIEGVMNGIPRSFYRSGFNLTFLIFYISPPFIGYVILHFLVHIIGYIGMYYLLKRHFLVNNQFILVTASLFWGLVSYSLISFGISIAGQPLLLFAFLNLLMNTDRLSSFVIVLLFPFFSFLPVTLPFFIPILLLIGIRHYYINNRIPILFFTAILTMCVINLLVEFNLVYSMFSSGIESHRLEFNKNSSLLRTLYLFSYGNIYDLLHAKHSFGTLGASLWPAPVILAIASGLLFKQRFNKTQQVLLLSLIAIVFWIPFSKMLGLWLGNYIAFLKNFDIQRFYLISPMLWLILFAITINKYNFKKNSQKVVAIIMLSLMLFGILRNNKEFIQNVKIVVSNHSNWPSFVQFYDASLFQEVKDLMDAECDESYNVMCIGFHPSVAQFNKIKTLDSYQNNYPLEYKHDFREIIAGELDRNESIKATFDLWGSKCYSFSSELGKNYFWEKDATIKIQQPDYDYDKIKSMNGKFILSSVEIKVNEDIEFLESFTSSNSYWEIYVYKITEANK
ncbi:DUF6044 family protein [Candidatus Venteria ishoeyi]|uniref:Bacterial membrane protein YfhO n=1 Tax=Candidatus Venteria ishoeyi TaxID=1899563 RepID=A0A1H6F549_9GAMM|nr:DUF6044 family protein [Candidatus Venteria ishoeyi]SEH05287.1 Uncharacterised protein [Candidatus Venteria ishoeyi]